ncbi:uncharacterized protein [Haliotis asinina]|uniref:uncharacterized protein n=1 Tax=Haliotis asinina TaxID=109174 RepID=UPI003531B218
MHKSTQLGVRIGFLCFIALLDGMADSCMGPALRDLQCTFNVTQQQISLLHPVITAGRVVGSLLFLKMRRCFNIYGIAAASMTTACCILASVPLVPIFWIALALSGGAGLADGFTIHAMVLLSGELSKEHAATIHIIVLAMTAGHFAGPFAISLFLSDNHYTYHNGSIFNHINTTFIALNSSVHLQEDICQSFSSHLKYGFLLIAGPGVFVLPGYMLAHKSFQKDINTKENPVKEKTGIITSSTADGMFLFIIIIYTTICGNMIFVYGQYLPTFGIHSKLHAGNTQMAYVSISFYACITIGRLLGTLCSQVVSQIVLINVCTAGTIMMSVMLVCVSEINITCLWTGTGILAAVCGPVFPAIQTWALDSNAHRYVLYGISSIVDTVGYAVMSLLIGQLMASIFVQMLHYVLFVVSLLQLIMIMLLYLIVRKQVLSEKNGYSNIE